MILVVGANGQLGTAIVKRLMQKHRRVRVMVRRPEAAAYFASRGCQTVLADATQPDSLPAAFPEVETLIVTANSALPAPHDRFADFEDAGMANLIRTARHAGAVRQFIFTSVPEVPGVERVPLLRWKHVNERRLKESGLGYTIIRAPAFMDVAFAAMGSDIPVRGTDSATILRPFPFAHKHFEKVRYSIETKGVVELPGGDARHAYICVDDVAEFHVAAAGNPRALNRTLNIGGPELLSAEEVAGIYEKVLRKPLKRKVTTPFVFRALAAVLAPFNPAASNLMAINYLSATRGDDLPDALTLASEFGVRLTSAEEFLQSKVTG